MKLQVIYLSILHKRPTISSLDVVQSPPALAKRLSLRVAFLIAWQYTYLHFALLVLLLYTNALEPLQPCRLISLIYWKIIAEGLHDQKCTSQRYAQRHHHLSSSDSCSDEASCPVASVVTKLTCASKTSDYIILQLI